MLIFTTLYLKKGIYDEDEIHNETRGVAVHTCDCVVVGFSVLVFGAPRSLSELRSSRHTAASVSFLTFLYIILSSCQALQRPTPRRRQLTYKERVKVHTFAEIGRTRTAISRQLGIPQSTISCCLRAPCTPTKPKGRGLGLKTTRNKSDP